MLQIPQTGNMNAAVCLPYNLQTKQTEAMEKLMNSLSLVFSKAKPYFARPMLLLYYCNNRISVRVSR